MSNVYIDVLIFENMVMNCVILHITSKVTSFRTKWYRLLVGATVGTVYAVIALWIDTFFSALIGKILLSAIMVWLTFFPLQLKKIAGQIRNFIRLSAIFYGVTFLFAGLSFALLIMLRIKSAGNISVTVCIGYLIFVAIIHCVRKRKSTEESGANVFIQFDRESDNGVWLPAIVDTGNSLRDPFTGMSVIVAELNALKELLPEEILTYISEKNCNAILDDVSAVCGANGWYRRFRLVPYRSVGQENGILPGFKADVVRVSPNSNKGSEAELTDVVICLYEMALSENEEYRALLAPDMIA